MSSQGLGLAPPAIMREGAGSPSQGHRWASPATEAKEVAVQQEA